MPEERQLIEVMASAIACPAKPDKSHMWEASAALRALCGAIHGLTEVIHGRAVITMVAPTASRAPAMQEHEREQEARPSADNGRRKWQQRDVDTANTMIMAGRTDEEIGAAIGRTAMAIATARGDGRLLRGAGKTPARTKVSPARSFGAPRERKMWSDEERAKAARLLDEGLSYGQVGAVIGRSGRAIQDQRSDNLLPVKVHRLDEICVLSGQMRALNQGLALQKHKDGREPSPRGDNG